MWPMASMSPQRMGMSISWTSFFCSGMSSFIAVLSSGIAIKMMVNRAGSTRSDAPSDRKAVIGADDGAVDEVTLVGGQHHQHGVQVFGAAHALARQHADQLAASVGLPVVAVQLGVDVAGADRPVRRSRRQ